MMNELQSQRPRTVHLCNRTYESKSQTSQCNMMNEPQSQKSQCNIMNEPQSQISRKQRGFEPIECPVPKPSKSTELEQSPDPGYRIGDFLIASCGKVNIPCFIVQTPSGMQPLPEVGVWVQYLKKVRASLWSIQEKAFFLEFHHICRRIEPPSVKVMGTHVYYDIKFK
ncbi:hypothetical protein ScPMuIL_015166 [Solemya velum]